MNKGMDICYHQGDIDFRKAKADGIDFIIPRDGWGTSDIDPKLVEYAKNAQDQNIGVPGVYHFIYALNIQQAVQNAARAVENAKAAGLPQSTVIWCDLEYDTVENAKKQGINLTAKDQRAFAEAFCNYCLAQGYPSGIYCNADYIVNVYGRDITDHYDIWLADLDGDPDFPCVYRQYDWYARPDGCPVNVDLDEYIGMYTAGTAKPRNGKNGILNAEFAGNPQESEVKMSKYQIMTDEEWVAKLKKLARGKSNYWAKFPYNLLYWTGERFYGDCSNIEKALFNGRDIDSPEPGSYAWPLPATGDATEYALLMQCSDIQWGNFAALKAGEPRLLYQEGHIGAYLGEEWEEPGQGIVNCAECTPAWEDGIQFSYVAPNGARSWCKGGAVRSYWEAHGLASKWVYYTDEDTMQAVQDGIQGVSEDVKGAHYDAADLAVMIIRNKYGNGAARKANLKAEGYTDDEISSAQAKVNNIVWAANKLKEEAEKRYTVIIAAYDVVAGKYGDGADRKAALLDAYGEELAGLIQEEVNDLMES